MTEIAFYHLTKSSLEAALPKLLEKTLKTGKRAVVVAGSTQRAETLNSLLWTYKQGSWLPHGASKDGNAEEQPIWIATDDKPLNGATFLFLTDGTASEVVGDFERCFELFDGNDPAAVETARKRWKAYKDADHELTYWQQTARGGWEKKG